MYTFCIEYDAFLNNGLMSCRGGYARGLQSWALCLSQRGHQVDVYTIDPHLIKQSYPNIAFLDLYDTPHGTAHGPSHRSNEVAFKSREEIDKVYDVVFFNGWSRDTCPYKAKLYLYLEWSKNWMICRPNQIKSLKEDNVIICYPFRFHKDHFMLDNIFVDKTFLLPFPLFNPESSLEKVKKKNNYEANNWSISVRHEMPEGKEYIENIKKMIINKCGQHNNTMIDFPVEQPYESIWKLMPLIRLLLPLSDSASSIEAILSGTVSLPVFMDKDRNPAGQVLRDGAIKAGILMERPPKNRELSDMIDYVLSSRETYTYVLNCLRDSIVENTFENTYGILMELIKKRI